MDRFSKISSFLLNEISAGNKISEDSLRVFSEEIFAYLNTPMLDTPHSFDELSILLKQYWYEDSDIHDKKISSSFVLGFLLGNIELANRKKQLNAQYKKSQTLISQYKKYNDLFSLIAKNQGIMHKELASKLKKSESSLSQMLSRSILQPYIYAYNLGREKYYYLTTEGHNILKAFEDEKKVVTVFKDTKINKSDDKLALLKNNMQFPNFLKQDNYSDFLEKDTDNYFVNKYLSKIRKASVKKRDLYSFPQKKDDIIMKT